MIDPADVAFENNFEERQIRPAVILRKNSQSNRSDRGAATQAILMSVYRTLKLRGLNPTKTIADAGRTQAGFRDGVKTIKRTRPVAEPA